MLNIPEIPNDYSFAFFAHKITNQAELREIVKQLVEHGQEEEARLLISRIKITIRSSRSMDNKKVKENQKPSIRDDFYNAEDNYIYMKDRGYSPEEIKQRMDEIYRDYSQELERRRKSAPPNPFKIGDFIGNRKSSMNHQYYRIKKVAFDPFRGWTAEGDSVVSKDGINPAISSTTLRKQARSNYARCIQLNDPNMGWQKVSEELIPKMFSRHPSTTIFFIA